MSLEQMPPTRLGETDRPQGSSEPSRIEMPAATIWPLVLALGASFLAVGLVTNLTFSAFGILLALLGLAGWVYQQFSGLGREWVEVVPPHERPRPVLESSLGVEAPREGAPGHRTEFPEKIHPYSAGVWGGICGGAAMAVLALTYGLISGHGIWYPVNLLAGTVLPRFGQSVAELERFSMTGLLVGSMIHAIASAGNGLLAGVLLPMMPRWPVLWAGIVAPLLWCGAVYGFMGVINPLLERHISWPWFIASQFAYGLVLGLVVVRSEKIPVRRRKSDPSTATYESREPAHERDEGRS